MDDFPAVDDGVAFVVGEGEDFDWILYAVGGSESAAGMIATPAGDETPAADAGTGLVGNTYTDPTYGWTIAWDPELWYPIDSSAGELFLFSQQGDSRVIFNNTERYGGDLAACVDAVGSGSGYEPILDAAGEPIAGEEEGRAYAAFRSGPEVYAVDCRVLGGEAILGISHFANLVDYPAEALAVEDLLTALVIPAPEHSALSTQDSGLRTQHSPTASSPR
jgi:hypothetical protein